ncbi:MAG: hypothetical protein NZ903_02290, partial [Candidatus Micrarchaeota archaeon]|nr:hypothetical protein [Candidatus Micrarchaeota archaeon]
MVATMQEIVEHSIASIFTTNWFETSILALILSAALSAIAWLISSAFQSNELRGWAKKELSEFIVSALILVLSAPLLVLITSLTIAYATAADPTISYERADPFSLANNYLNRIESDLVSVYGEITGTLLTLAGVSAISLDIGALAKLLSTFGGFITTLTAFFVNFSLFISIGAPFTLVINFIETLQSSFIFILLAFFIQKEILLFIQAASLQVLMPTGILLRAFPLTRRAGSTLIALTLTLFVVYPLTLAFIGHMYISTYNAIAKGEATPLPETKFNLLIERELPTVGNYYLDYKQEFRWIAYYNISYSIWHDIPCGTSDAGFSSQITNNNLDIPPDSYTTWRITREETIWTTTPDGIQLPTTITLTTCYKKFKSGS